MNLKKKIVDLAKFIIERQKLGLVVWLLLIIFGSLAYFSVLNREGFPAIQFPTGLVQGSYFVDDAEEVDQKITKPVTELLKQDELIESTQATANNNSFTIFATYDENLTNEEANQRFRESIEESEVIPDEARYSFIKINPSAYLGEYQVLISVYSSDDDALSLQEKANKVKQAAELELDVAEVNVIEQVQDLVNPRTGQSESVQTGYSLLVNNQSGQLVQNNSVLLGVKANQGFDVISFSDQVRDFIKNFEKANSDTQISVAADFAPSIQQQISNLENNVVTGLLVVVIISFLLISWRSSLITALFISTVLLTTFTVMLIVGITINTISLFAVVLALGLFVDDATIVVEAIETNLNKKNPVKSALEKVSAASISGTLTTVMVFLPLVFVGGVLGEFIRILPLTLIIALIVSLLLSLTLIPLLSSYIIVGKNKTVSPLQKVEEWTADKLSELVRRTRSRIGILIGLGMITLSLVFIVGSFYFAGRLKFNIFPPAKDANEISININYPAGLDINKSKQITEEVNRKIAEISEDNLKRIVYYRNSAQSASGVIELVDFKERQQTSVEIVNQIEEFARKFNKGDIAVAQIDGGPPSEQFPFKLQIFGNQEKARVFAMRIEKKLQGSTIEINAQESATIVKTDIAGIDNIIRTDAERFVEVLAAYDKDEVTALVQNTETLVNEQFQQQAQELGLEFEFDFGQESDNQESFKSLAIIGPISLLAIFILLAFQFKSLLLPLLIFMAVPFSFFGVFAGLYFTDNPIGFFTLVGFLGLIGIAVNNTILLVDYANQEIEAGKDYIDAAANATKKRFRPLITTSFTTVAALLPLALNDPFWEALAFTIIFGLLSSTLLVVISFPYYYLFAQLLKKRFLKLIKKA